MWDACIIFIPTGRGGARRGAARRGGCAVSKFERELLNFGPLLVCRLWLPRFVPGLSAPRGRSRGGLGQSHASVTFDSPSRRRTPASLRSFHESWTASKWAWIEDKAGRRLEEACHRGRRRQRQRLGAPCTAQQGHGLSTLGGEWWGGLVV